jgi:hypothetical protein
MNAMGVRIEHNGKMVQNKINHIGLRWKLADDFVNRTGQGLFENDQVQEFNDLVKKRFLYYFELLPVMQDRSSIRPPYTSKTIDDKSLLNSINKQKEYKSYLGSVNKSQNHRTN